MLNTVFTFTMTYWYAIALVLIVALLLVARQMKGQARSIALQYIAAAEKMVFATTDSKLNVVSAVAYDALPEKVKLFITPSSFDLIVLNAYEELKGLITKLHEDPTVPAQKKE